MFYFSPTWPSSECLFLRIYISAAWCGSAFTGAAWLMASSWPVAWSRIPSARRPPSSSRSCMTWARSSSDATRQGGWWMTACNRSPWPFGNSSRNLKETWDQVWEKQSTVWIWWLVGRLVGYPVTRSISRQPHTTVIHIIYRNLILLAHINISTVDICTCHCGWLLNVLDRYWNYTGRSLAFNVAWEFHGLFHTSAGVLVHLRSGRGGWTERLAETCPPNGALASWMLRGKLPNYFVPRLGSMPWSPGGWWSLWRKWMKWRNAWWPSWRRRNWQKKRCEKRLANFGCIKGEGLPWLEVCQRSACCGLQVSWVCRRMGKWEKQWKTFGHSLTRRNYNRSRSWMVVEFLICFLHFVWFLQLFCLFCVGNPWKCNGTPKNYCTMDNP